MVVPVVSLPATVEPAQGVRESWGRSGGLAAFEPAALATLTPGARTALARAVSDVAPARPAPLTIDRTTETDQAQNRPRCSAGVRIYRDGSEGTFGVGLPCGKRSCPACRPRWIRHGHLLIVSGFEPFAAVGDFRALTLTAPGMDLIRSSDDLVAWNRSHGRRLHSFLVMIRRLAPSVEFVRILELQARGAIHSHWIMRGASHLTKRQVRRCAVAAGFGSQLDWSAVRTMEGLARYLVGYMMKSRDVFPSGTRVLVRSRGWTVIGSEAMSEPEPARSAPAERSEEAGAGPSEGSDVLIASEVWYGGPPPGIGWSAWADDAVMIAAGRRVLRHRRLVADREGFEATSRDRWLRWQGSTNGRAALGRQTRGGRCRSPGLRRS